MGEHRQECTQNKSANKFLFLSGQAAWRSSVEAGALPNALSLRVIVITKTGEGCAKLSKIQCEVAFWDKMSKIQCELAVSAVFCLKTTKRPPQLLVL